MKRCIIFLLGVLALALPLTAAAEALESGLQDVLGQLDLQALEQASNGLPLLEGEPSQWLARLASGKVLLNPEGVLQWLLSEAAGVFRQTMWRMTRLWIPALLSAVGEQFFPENSGAGKAARYTGLLTVMGFLCADLKDYVQLCSQSVGDMSGWMQAIFPLLVRCGRYGQFGLLPARRHGRSRFHDHTDPACDDAVCRWGRRSDHGRRTER